MKKFLVLVLLGMISHYSQAQIGWGIRAGLGYTTSYSSNAYGDVNTKGKASFEIGPTAYISFNEKAYLNTGLNLSYKRFGDENDTYESDGSINYLSLELPVNVGMRFNLGRTALYAQAGPFVGVKLHEKVNFNESIGGVNGISTDYLNRFNYGIGAAVGINVVKFKIELGYQMGLANILSDKFWKDYYGYDFDDYYDTDDKTKVHLNTLFLGVSYVF